jgi:hypothetical protein
MRAAQDSTKLEADVVDKASARLFSSAGSLAPCQSRVVAERHSETSFF